MEVPLGGSSCAKCEYLRGTSDCANRGFQKWNADSAKLPKPANRYCCDLFEAGRKEASTKAQVAGQSTALNKLSTIGT